MNSIIEVYLNKIKKDMFNYALFLDDVLDLKENNKLWKNKTELKSILDDIIEEYVDKYYFININSLNDGTDYYNKNNINIINIIKDKYDDVENNNFYEMCLLSALICVASYASLLNNPFKNNMNYTKKHINRLINDLSKVPGLIVKDYDYENNKLFNLLEKSINDQIDFFKTFDDMEIKNYYETFNGYSLVRYNYDKDELSAYQYKMVDKYENKYKLKFNNISRNLITLKITKELVNHMNKNIYLIPLEKKEINKTNVKLLNNEYIKKYSALYIDINNYVSELDTLNNFKKEGFKVIYYYEGNEYKDISDKFDIDIVVNSDMFVKCKFYSEELNKKRINLIEKNNIVIVKESECSYE